MMEAYELIDMGATWSVFTWERRHNRRRMISKCLDRDVGDVSWRHNFPEAYVEHLARVYSGHCPVLVKCNAALEDRLARPLCFHAAWAAHPPFAP